MGNSLLILAVLIGVVLFFTSCKTYYIPVESFKQQFSEMNALSMREVTVQGPMGNKVKYQAYTIDYIKAVDKKGNSVDLKNSPSIEIRFTDTANKMTTFYFDLIQINGDNITGSQSRMITSIRKTISINAVKKIEVQNGKKNFRYVN